MKNAIFCVLVLFCAAQIATAEEDFHCSWKLLVGREKLDPIDAPDGFNRYIAVMNSGKGALSTVATVLKSMPNKSEFSEVREMKALGNLLTARLTPNAVRWLCKQELLDTFIVQMEIDQPVALFKAPPAQLID